MPAPATQTQRSTRSAYRPAPSIKEAQTPRRALQRGMQGPSVAQLQRALNAQGAGLDVDGKLGPKTEAAIRQYQQQNGLRVDGKAGRETLGSLQRSARSRDAFESGTAANRAGALRAPTEDALRNRAPGTERAGDHQRPMSPRGRRPGPTGPTSTRARPVGPDATPTATNRAEAPSTDAPRGDNPRNGTATFDRVSNAGRRNQMVTGRITVNGRSYPFRSGGFGKGNLPAGTYTVTPHMQSRSDRAMNVGGVGYSFALNDKYDSRVGANRSLLRIHPDGNGPGTLGCIGIVGGPEVQRQFRADMNAELRRNGGRFTLRVG